ncbi:MAG: hypothetical protein ABI641_04540 [Caldimonas sp.]
MTLLASHLVRHTLPLLFALVATVLVLTACGDRRTEAPSGPVGATETVVPPPSVDLPASVAITPVPELPPRNTVDAASAPPPSSAAASR